MSQKERCTPDLHKCLSWDPNATITHRLLLVDSRTFTLQNHTYCQQKFRSYSSIRRHHQTWGGGERKAHHIIPFHAIHSTWRGRRRIRRSSWCGWLACKSIWRKSSSIFEEREKEHKSSKVLIMSLLSNANKTRERQKGFHKSSRGSKRVLELPKLRSPKP